MKLYPDDHEDNCEVPAALKAIRLIELMGREKRPLRLTEIAEKLKTNKAMVLRLLRVFEREGWLRRVSEKGPYQMTLRPLHYVATAIESNELVSYSTPMVKRIAMMTNCLVTVSVPDEEQTTCVVCTEQASAVRVSTRVGYQYPYHSSAPGKAVLAYQPQDFIEEIISRPLVRFTDTTITDRDRLLEELATIRRVGYAIDLEEGYRGINCLNVPIFDYRNSCIATLGLCTLVSYDTVDDLKKKYLPHLIKAAGKISDIMGYVGEYPVLR
ncbi:MAG: IclR family transcriptional regulator [Planctomycetia bacterium]|nr:IclR family transcriptional regulator [Planctomycetia bacterium]